MNTEEVQLQDNLTPVDEPVVKFRAISDRDVYKVVSANNQDITLIEITGFDLQFNFNMEYLRSYEDVTAAADGIGTMFKDLILEKLLEYKQKP